MYKKKFSFNLWSLKKLYSQIPGPCLKKSFGAKRSTKSWNKPAPMYRRPGPAKHPPPTQVQRLILHDAFPNPRNIAAAASMRKKM